MEAAPSETTDEEDWPVPPGPHLPAVVYRLPVVAWLFVALAIARQAWSLREAGFGGVIDPVLVGQLVLFGLPSVISILLVAALLARHRDAPSRLRMLLVGMVALAAVEGLRVLGTPLQPIFERLTPGDETASFLVPSELIYQVGVNLLNAGAVSAIALGLARARRFEDRSSSWPVVSVLTGLIVIVAVTGIVSISRLPAEQLPMTPIVVAYIVSTVVLNVLSATAFAYLTAATTAGARAGEDPWLAWCAAAAGSWLVIGSLAALGLVGLLEASPATADLMTTLFDVVSAIFSIGFLGLLLGFVLGLPKLDPGPADDGAGGGHAAGRQPGVDPGDVVA